MEVLRRGGAVRDAHVDVGRELQEPLGPRARVIGPLPFVRVRQQQHQRRPQPPLPARRDDELVDHHLRAVDEVAVLRFPDHEPRRLLDVVAVLEADDARSRSADCCGSRTPRAPAAATAAARAPRRSSTSCNTACRWLNVPRSTSSPVSRMLDAVGENRGQRELLGGGPVDRALVRSRRARAARFSRARSSLRWMAKSGGRRSSAAFSSRSRSSGTAVSRLRRGARRRRLRLRLDEVPLRPQRVQRRLQLVRCTSGPASSATPA